MEKRHLWRGEWIADQELVSRLERLGQELSVNIGKSLATQTLIAAAEALNQKISQQQVPQLITCIIQQGYNLQEATETLRELSSVLNKQALQSKLKRELGSYQPAQFRRISYEQPILECWRPLGVLVHIAPANALAIPALSVLEGLLTGNINIMKDSPRNGEFSMEFLKALIDADSSGELKNFVYVFSISSADDKTMDLILQQADGVAVWGGEEAVAAVRSKTPTGVRFIDWGHKLSFAYVTSEKANEQPVLEAIAREICVVDQQACSSPQCVFLDTADRRELASFAERLAAVLAEVGRHYPRKLPSTQEQAEITTAIHLMKAEEVLGAGRVIEDETGNGSFYVLVDYEPYIKPSPLFRTILVKPLLRSDIIANLRPVRGYLQTAGLACAQTDLAELSVTLANAGVLRITPIGEMLSSYAGEPHDGVYALPRYAKRVSCKLSDDLSRITSFGAESKPFIAGEQPPLLTKEGFLQRGVQADTAKIYVKSGGSSSKPKLSGYSWEDYALQMQAGADGLFFAGLDPTTDRCMNLFDCGHLYGGFLSFFSVLQLLGAVQFPMAADNDLAYVADMIIEHKVNTLLGMPSYIRKLFTQQHDKLKAYHGVEKIFYGGEHMTPAQIAFFQQEFGVRLVKSGAYGSNDAGPMGYACEYSTGGIHHVLREVQHMEIVQIEQDQPVAHGEIGRIVVSRRAIKDRPLLRYEIGDLGRWVPGACACGSPDPRFELLGRYGDIVRCGGEFFNYRRIVRIISSELGYSGEVQMVVDVQERGKDSITLRLLRDNSLTAAAVQQTILEKYAEFREMIERDQVLTLSVEFVDQSDFEYIASSGKLREIIDRRQSI